MTCLSILSPASLRVLLRSNEAGQEMQIHFKLKKVEQVLVLGLLLSVPGHTSSPEKPGGALACRLPLCTSVELALWPGVGEFQAPRFINSTSPSLSRNSHFVLFSSCCSHCHHLSLCSQLQPILGCVLLEFESLRILPLIFPHSCPPCGTCLISPKATQFRLFCAQKHLVASMMVTQKKPKLHPI